MLITDKTGRKIRPGMIVDVRVDPIVMGQVIAVHDSSIELPGKQSMPPYIEIALLPVNAAIDKMRDQTTAQISGVYIIAEPPADFEKQLASRNGRSDNEESNVKPFESGLTKDGKNH